MFRIAFTCLPLVSPARCALADQEERAWTDPGSDQEERAWTDPGSDPVKRGLQR